MLLKPLDVAVGVMAAVLDKPGWTNAAMAEHLGMDGAQVYRAVRQAAQAGLLLADAHQSRTLYRPHHAALLEFLIHGVKYFAVPARGRLTRGMPTAHAAPVLASSFRAGDEPMPVWPDPAGTERGESFEPLHRCVPGAARRNERFYAAMALVDAIRGGRARERKLASSLLTKVIHAGG